MNTAVTVTMVLQSLLQARALVTTNSADLQLLGAGSGRGSCASPPFRASEVHWRFGCPPFASCCTELGYCRSQVMICAVCLVIYLEHYLSKTIIKVETRTRREVDEVKPKVWVKSSLKID